MSFFTNIRADRFITELKEAKDVAAPQTQKAIAKLRELGAGAIELIAADDGSTDEIAHAYAGAFRVAVLSAAFADRTALFAVATDDVISRGVSLLRQQAGRKRGHMRFLHVVSVLIVPGSTFPALCLHRSSRSPRRML